MKSTAIIASISAAALAAVLLVLSGMHLGQKSAPAPQRPAVVNAVPSPAPNRAPAPVAQDPAPRTTPPRPAPRAAVVPTLAQSTLLGQPAVQTGILRTVDPSGTLTYLPVDLDAAAPTPPKGALVDKDTQITLDARSAALADLKPGMALAFLDPLDKPLAKLEAFSLLPDGKPHTTQGPIDKITATQIVFLPGRREMFPAALNITPDTPTTIDGMPAKASDLRYRMLVSVKYQGIDALSLAASTIIMDGAPHHADGTLLSADANGIALHVNGNAGFDVKLKTDPSFKIQRETGKAPTPTLTDATLADLKAGQHVVATYTNGSASDITIKLAAAARTRTPATPPVSSRSALP